ncbi:MAG: hypothetical protein EOP33_04220 [Rickettsiaceae bacterium]|nr:MAG: hypothetical protein EOP33_04220 [Rickettsiaceae bacterium]
MSESNHEEITKKGKEEAKAIKNDIKDIIKRMSSLKGEAVTALYDDSEELMTAMSSMKDKVVGSTKNNIKDMCSHVENNPMKSALYLFGAGVILALLMRK